MSAQHTPGPWEVIQKPGIGSIIVVKGRHLATVHSERDAALMGAAPELLALLIDAVESFGPDVEGGEADEWVRFTRAAIAKATGSKS